MLTFKELRALVRKNTVTVSVLPDCAFCSGAAIGIAPNAYTIHVPARYDGATRGYGPWAYMCRRHFKSAGVGLGVGRGQRLVLEVL
jgi:hypothetical protein